MRTDRTAYARWRAWVLLAAAVFLLADLQSFPIALWDESRLAVNALEMRARGLSLVTTFGFQPDLWNTKPPLLIWLMVASAQVFGPHEWALRLPSGLATLGSVALTMALTRRMSRSTLAPVAAAVMLVASRGFVGRHTGQTADYDALLCFFTTAYGYVLFRALHRRRPPWSWTLAAGALIAGAVLTKGVAGLIPGAGVAVYLLVQDRWRRPLQSLAWPAAGLLCLGLIGGFYAAREAAGPGYLAAVVDNELGRSASKLTGHVKPIWFYLVYIFAGFGFSIGLLAAPLLVEVRRLRGQRRDGAIFALCMAFGTIGVFSLCQTRIRWYGAPAYPFLAVACALGLESLAARAQAGGRPVRALLIGGGALLCAIIVILRDVDPLIKGEQANYQYGAVFERLGAQGVRQLSVIDGGVPNEERDFPEYAPQLDFYVLQARERGLSVTRLPATRPIAWTPGRVVASCDEGWTALLDQHGPELAHVRGCAAVRRPGAPRVRPLQPRNLRPNLTAMQAHAACAHAEPAAPSQAALTDALARAEARTTAEGQRWTEPRRRIYELLLQAGGPVKAYDLMEVYAVDRVAKPPTVYRALDFLEQAGLAHRIASLNAYVACDGHDPAHVAAFLICDCCGSAEEFEPGQVRSATTAANARGFKPRTVALEVRGECRRCAVA